MLKEAVAIDQPANLKTRERTTNKWFAGIDSIRFVMAFIVMLGHYDNPYIKYLKGVASPAAHVAGNFLGVAFPGVPAVIAFFIISGFVIHYPNRDGIRSVRKFYLRRYFRVLIPLIAVKLISIRFGSPENVVVWSLYCELIYYTLYPAIYRIPITWTKKLVIAFALCIGAICIGGIHDLASMFAQKNLSYKGEYWQLGISYTWLAGLPCWLMGVKMADEINRTRSSVSRIKILTLRTLVYCCSVLAVVARFHFFVSYLVSMTVLAFILYYWIREEVSYFKVQQAPGRLERWGKFSYSLYLCHPLIHVFLLMYIPLTLVTYPVYLALAVACSYGFYLLLEKPSHLLAQRIGKVEWRSRLHK